MKIAPTTATLHLPLVSLPPVSSPLFWLHFFFFFSIFFSLCSFRCHLQVGGRRRIARREPKPHSFFPGCSLARSSFGLYFFFVLFPPDGGPPLPTRFLSHSLLCCLLLLQSPAGRAPRLLSYSLVWALGAWPSGRVFLLLFARFFSALFAIVLAPSQAEEEGEAAARGLATIGNTFLLDTGQHLSFLPATVVAVGVASCCSSGCRCQHLSRLNCHFCFFFGICYLDSRFSSI